jgi:hypothetical protein
LADLESACWSIGEETALKKGYEGPASALRLYDAVIGGNPDAQRNGVTTPYTSRSGHMYSFLDAGGTMALALAANDQAEFIARYNTHVVEQHGRVMKDFVAVPADLLDQTSELQAWFDLSYGWTGTRKPKPTTRRAKKAPS